MSTRLPLTATWPWLDELAGLGTGRRPAGAVHDVVEAQLEEPQQVLAGDAVTAVRLLVEVAELPLREAVGEAGLLLLLELEQVLATRCPGGGCGRARRAGRAASPWRRSRPWCPRCWCPAGARRGPWVRCNEPSSDPPTLGRAATVVRHRRDVLDAGDLDAGVLDRADGGLAAGARTLDHTSTLRTPCSMARRAHCSAAICAANGVRLARALEADVAGRGPGQHVAVLVGDRHDRVVERALDVRDAVGDVLALLACGDGGPRRLASPSVLPRPSSCRPRSSSGPCGCGRWCGCAGPARAGPCGGGGPGSSRSPSCA